MSKAKDHISIREGCQKKSGKSVVFCQQKIYPNFFEIASIIAETNFTLGLTSKTNKFSLLMVIICPELANKKGPIKDGINIRF